MKRNILIISAILILLSLITITIIYYKYQNRVTINGNLKVVGTEIHNRFGKSIQLKGLSSHGIQWDDDNIVNYDNIKKLRDEWNINVFRIAMYTEEGGYIENKEEIKNKAISIIEMCIDLDIYVVIDWHILSDNNPNIHKQEAIEFFNEISDKYRDTPNVLYEICNEPNGEDVGWIKDITPYSRDIIETIRKNSPKSIIIVGTANWAKNIIEASNDKLPYENILYSFHFYAGTHGEVYRVNFDYALERGLPIIVSEWGTGTAENATEVYEDKTKKWIDFLNQRNISWINWSFSNKNESTSVLKENATKLNDENLSKSGKLLKKFLSVIFLNH